MRKCWFFTVYLNLLEQFLDYSISEPEHNDFNPVEYISRYFRQFTDAPLKSPLSCRANRLLRRNNGP